MSSRGRRPLFCLFYLFGFQCCFCYQLFQLSTKDIFLGRTQLEHNNLKCAITKQLINERHHFSDKIVYISIENFSFIERTSELKTVKFCHGKLSDYWLCFYLLSCFRSNQIWLRFGVFCLLFVILDFSNLITYKCKVISHPF